MNFLTSPQRRQSRTDRAIHQISPMLLFCEISINQIMFSFLLWCVEVSFNKIFMLSEISKNSLEMSFMRSPLLNET